MITITNRNGDKDVEISTKSLRTIDIEHAEIHEGDSFVVSGRSGTIGNGSSFYVHFKTTSDLKACHNLLTHIGGLGQFYIELLEGTTIGGSTATVTPINRNRALSSKAASTVVKTGGTISGGAVIHFITFGDGGSGDTGRGTGEFILKNDTQYTFKLTSESAGNVISYIFDFYEATILKQ